jgi:hypothetical protein
VISLSSPATGEQASWQKATDREKHLYRIAEPPLDLTPKESTGRTWLDWLLVALSTGVFALFGAMARVPKLQLQPWYLALLVAAMIAALGFAGVKLWRLTRFR